MSISSDATAELYIEREINQIKEAKHLLRERASLEAEIAKINDRLKALDHNADPNLIDSRGDRIR